MNEKLLFEDLAVIGKVISIVVKHLSKIDFEESN